jgi:hypothetical protein
MDFLKWVAVAILGVLAPAKALIISVFFLIVADLVTGIWAALKRKEEISSAVMRRTISKFVIYQVAVISAVLVETYMLENFVPVSKIIASVIGLVELKSILENCNYILGQDLFKLAIQKLGSDNDPKIQPEDEQKP